MTRLSRSLQISTAARSNRNLPTCAAQAANLGELASLFGDIEGMPRAQIEQRVRNALKWLADKPDQQNMSALLELIEINLPNLK